MSMDATVSNLEINDFIYKLLVQRWVYKDTSNRLLDILKTSGIIK